MRIRFALFDFDGVIADTEASNNRFTKRALAKYGVYLSEEEERSLYGVNDADVIRQFLERAPRPVTLEDYLRERRSMGNTYQNGNLEPMPGVAPLLEELRSRGVKTALVSSTSGYLIEAALERLGMRELFDAVVCGDMVSKKKPDPEPYQTAMKLLGAVPEECVIFEDSPVGIRSGKAAGVRVIGCQAFAIRQDTSQADYQLDAFADFGGLPLELPSRGESGKTARTQEVDHR